MTFRAGGRLPRESQTKERAGAFDASREMIKLEYTQRRVQSAAEFTFRRHTGLTKTETGERVANTRSERE